MQDAGTLLIRPISPDDRQQFVDAFERLSDSSRYRRFLTARHGLSAAEVRYFTEVDHHNHEALFAVDPESGAGIGVARYVRSESDRCVAELAVAVVDDWQGQGVGGRLTAALADRARAERITSFRALVLADNKPALGLLDELGRVRVVRRGFGTVELTVDLPERGLGHVARLLRAVAQGDIKALGHAGSAPE